MKKIGYSATARETSGRLGRLGRLDHWVGMNDENIPDSRELGAFG